MPLSRRSSGLVAKAVLVSVPVILLILGGLYEISLAIVSLLGLPALGPQPAVRLAGGAVFTAGLGLAAWVFMYRRPSDTIVSTYFTFMKLLTRSPLSEPEDRTEPLVISGPQRYLRHPLYLGVTTMFLGWSLLTSSTATLFTAMLVLLWFRFILIPFEEAELRAIFGDQYARYSDEVPMLIPFGRRRGRRS